MRKIRIFGLALAGAVALAGCGDDDGLSAGTLGSFEGTISGDVTATITEGNAAAVVDIDDDAWELALLARPVASAPYTIVLARRGATRPSNGTYTFGEGAGQFSGSLYVLSSTKFYHLTGGSLTITASSEEEVTGSFSVTAKHQDDAGRTVTITGEFTAECVPDEESNETCG